MSCLTDFGLSRTFEEAENPEFRIKIYGRLGYLDPELLGKLRPSSHPRHDIYGLAVLCWEIMSSQSPNSSTSRINPNLFKRTYGCPEDFHQLYEKCRSPTDRLTADDVVHELTRILAAASGDGATVTTDEANTVESVSILPSKTFGQSAYIPTSSRQNSALLLDSGYQSFGMNSG